MIYLFVIIVSATLAIIFLAHYFLFHTLVRFFDITGQAYLTSLKAAFIILSFSFIAASILINRFSNAIVRLYYTIAAVWLGVLLYFFIACLLLYFILFLGKIFSYNFNSKILIIVLLLAAVAVVIYGAASAQNLKIKKLDVKLPNLPEAWKGKSAVWISDLHLGAIDNYEFASKVAEQINSLNPDLLFIGGDFFDGQENIDLDRLAQIFSTISAPQGKYFITGNHEEFGDRTKYINALKGAGINFLDNKLVDLNGLQLIGLDYKSAYDRKNFAAIMENLKINHDRPSILLRHVPDKLDIAVASGISLTLCGHTHKGQLFPVYFVATLLYDGYGYGLKKTGQSLIYTSSGTGTWGPPMRVLADPEIVVVNFK